MSVLNEGTREGATQRTSEKDDVFKEKAEKAHIHEKLGRLLSFGRWSIVALRPPIHQIFIWIHEYCSPSTT